ncbi:response regulator [bacterium]|nr:response regulator [bacterium]
MKTSHNDKTDGSVKKPKKDSGIRILAVDDEEVMGYLIRRVIGHLGYELDWVQDCQSALEKIRACEYDVIISDYRLPGMTGEVFYQQVLNHDAGLARRMIFISGDTVSRNTLTFFRRVALPYFSKPFKIDALRDAIEEMIQNRRNPCGSGIQ